jgi:hypothetical protein
MGVEKVGTDVKQQDINKVDESKAPLFSHGDSNAQSSPQVKSQPLKQQDSLVNLTPQVRTRDNSVIHEAQEVNPHNVQEVSIMLHIDNVPEEQQLKLPENNTENAPVKKLERVRFVPPSDEIKGSAYYEINKMTGALQKRVDLTQEINTVVNSKEECQAQISTLLEPNNLSMSTIPNTIRVALRYENTKNELLETAQKKLVSETIEFAIDAKRAVTDPNITFQELQGICEKYITDPSSSSRCNFPGTGVDMNVITAMVNWAKNPASNMDDEAKARVFLHAIKTGLENVYVGTSLETQSNVQGILEKHGIAHEVLSVPQMQKVQEMQNSFSMADFSNTVVPQSKIIDKMTTNANIGRIFSKPENIAKLEAMTQDEGNLKAQMNKDTSNFLIQTFNIANNPDVTEQELDNLLKKYCRTKDDNNKYNPDQVNLGSKTFKEILPAINNGTKAEKLEALNKAVNGLINSIGSSYAAFLNEEIPEKKGFMKRIFG